MTGSSKTFTAAETACIRIHAAISSGTASEPINGLLKEAAGIIISQQEQIIRLEQELERERSL